MDSLYRKIQLTDFRNITNDETNVENITREIIKTVDILETFKPEDVFVCETCNK